MNYILLTLLLLLFIVIRHTLNGVIKGVLILILFWLAVVSYFLDNNCLFVILFVYYYRCSCTRPNMWSFGVKVI